MGEAMGLSLRLGANGYSSVEGEVHRLRINMGVRIPKFNNMGR